VDVEVDLTELGERGDVVGVEVGGEDRADVVRGDAPGGERRGQHVALGLVARIDDDGLVAAEEDRVRPGDHPVDGVGEAAVGPEGPERRRGPQVDELAAGQGEGDAVRGDQHLRAPRRGYGAAPVLAAPARASARSCS
jgi:hypothetical protein